MSSEAEIKSVLSCNIPRQLMTDGFKYLKRHSAHLFVKTEDVQTDSPKPKTHTQNADSGNPMERAWCDECGCGIWIRSPEQMPDLTFLKAGKVLSRLKKEMRVDGPNSVSKASSILVRFQTRPWRTGSRISSRGRRRRKGRSRLHN
jgi:hypothetical protein